MARPPLQRHPLQQILHVRRPEALSPRPHVKHYNQHAIGICYEGGLDEKGRPADTRTEAQKAAILFLLKDLKKDYPNAKVVGHRDFPNVKKECPCFDVASDPDYRQLNLD